MWRKVHRGAGTVVGAFAVLHVLNHGVGLLGVEKHLAFMESARRVYRAPLLEPVLLLSVGLQASSGLVLALRDRKQRSGFVPRLQAGAGLALALFLAIHVGAVLAARRVLHLDTNFFFAAAGLHVRPFHLFFAPYYFLGLAALLVHVGCAAYWHALRLSRAGAASLLVVVLVAAVWFSGQVVRSLAGARFPVDIPAPYRATFSAPSPTGG